MRKLFIAFLSLFMLTGCSTASQALAQEQAEPAVVEVTSITTNNPIIEIAVEDTWVLQYTISPVNATDKNVTIDTTNSQGVVDVVKDEYTGAIIATGKAAGNGIVSLVTNNGKFVSYSINVLPVVPDVPEIPVVYKADDVADYFNEHSIYGEVEYREDTDYVGYQLIYSFGYSTDDSVENLYWPIKEVAGFLPLYSSKTHTGYLWLYGNYTGYHAAVPDHDAYFIGLWVSSNHFAAVSAFTYIMDEELILNVCIYDGRSQLWVGLE